MATSPSQKTALSGPLLLVGSCSTPATERGWGGEGTPRRLRKLGGGRLRRCHVYGPRELVDPGMETLEECGYIREVF